MYYDIVKAKYVSDYKIKISFADGSNGIADLKEIISRGGIFSDLKDLNNFKNFFIHDELKVLTWQKEIDIAPETLYLLAVGEKIST
jgi:hypothetical protein